ncbi:MAG TPA: histidine kinase [Saprospiraceae bacterium]|nr:histidine kinase [Saprospiraceae bacterium]
MDSLQKLSNLQKGGSFFWVQSLLWLVFSLTLWYLAPSYWDLSFSVLWAVSNTIFYLILVTVNLTFLLPKYFLKQSFALYAGFIISLAFICTPLKVYFNYWLFDLFNKPPLEWSVDSKFTFISLIFIPSLSSLIRIPLEWFNMLKEKKNLETKTIESELQFLKNQINPHFLFNTLNNLYALTLKKSELAPEIILKLSDMMRYMLYECNENSVLLSKEIHYIQNYIELEKIRLSKHTEIELEIIGDISNVKIAPLLIIPFIENCFKHGVKLSQDPSYIHILVRLDENSLKLDIKNSKSAQIPSLRSHKTFGGIGLANVRKRLEFLYPKLHELIITDNPEQYHVHLFLNLNTPS